MSLVYNPKTETYGDNTTTAVVPPTDASVATVEPPKPIRKKRAPKHDFNDGRGRVFAHRHSNGGGWVEDTAFAAEDVYIGPSAEVVNYAQVFGSVRIEAKSVVSGYAKVFNDSLLQNRARVGGHAIVNGSTIRGSAYVRGNAEITRSTLADAVLVRGSSVVKGCRLNGKTSVDGNACVVAVTSSGFVFISNNANVFRSQLLGLVQITNDTTVQDAYIDVFGWMCSHFKPAEYEEKAQKIRPEYCVTIGGTAIIQRQSRITSPVRIEGHATLNNCQVDAGRPEKFEAFSPEALPEYPFDRPIIRDVAWRNANIRSRGQLDVLLAGNGTDQNAIPVIRPEQMQARYSLENLSRGRRVTPL